MTEFVAHPFFFLLLEMFYGAISNFAAIVDSPSNVSFLVRCIQLTVIFGDKCLLPSGGG